MKKKLKFLFLSNLIFFNVLGSTVYAGDFENGVEAFKNEEYQKSITYFLKSAKENPTDPEPYRWLAKCYTELFMIDMSLKAMNKVKKLEEDILLQKQKLKTEQEKNSIAVTNSEKIEPTVNIIINGVSEISTKKYTGKKRIKVAVLDFQNKNYYYSDRTKISQSVTEYLMSNIINSGINVIERSQINEITTQLRFDNSEYVLSNSAKKIGKLYGVDYLILGYILDFSRDKKYVSYTKQKNIVNYKTSIRLSTKLINLETGEIDFSEVLTDTIETSSSDNYNNRDFEMEDKIISDISKKISSKIITKLNNMF